MINKKNILFISFFISVLLTAIISIYLFDSTLPLKLERKIEKSYNLHSTKYMFHDYDKDGRGEWFEVSSREYEKRATVLFWMNPDVFYDEFSVKGRTNIQWIRFDDLNGDKKDELIMFSVNRDSVYLSIINLHTLQFIKKEMFLIAREAESDQFWDVTCYYIGAIENELFFFISSGYSHKPRVFLSYNLEEKKVKNNLIVASPFRDHYIVDINNDGKDEIVSIGGGTGNRPGEKFTDMTSWIFVLDNNLDFVVPPKNIGVYPNAGLQANIFNEGNKNSIFAWYTRRTATSDKSKIILLDDSLRMKRTLEISANSIISANIRMDGEECGVIATENGILQILDSELNVIKSQDIEHENPLAIFSTDYNYDGASEIILINETSIKIYNEGLRLLLDQELTDAPINIENYITINQSGKSNEAGIALNMPSGFKYFAIIENNNYTLLPVFTILIFAGILFLTYVGFNWYNNYQLFVKRKSFVKSDYAFAIFSISGELIEKTVKYKESANIDSLKELLKLVRYNKSEKILIEELQQVNTKTWKHNNNLIKIALLDDTRFLHEPIIYSHIEYDSYSETSTRELWSKSIQKIAHDIKTPISSLLLNLKALGLRLDKVDFSGKQDFVSDIEAMKIELSRVNNLTRGFLRFTNIEEPKLKIVNIKKLVDDVVKTFLHYTNNGIVIDVNIDNQIYIDVDDYQLREVLQVLIENAIEAMNHKGTVSLTAEEVESVEDSSQSEIMLTVADHGSGMCKDTVGKIFDTTFTSKPTGNGLGLPIAKRIVELHKGRIEVYSREGIGTTFKVFLPLNK